MMNFNDFVNEVKVNIKLFLPKDYENGAAGSVVSGNNNGEGSSASAGVTALAGEAVQGAGAVSQELLDQICARLKQEGMQIGNAPAMGDAEIEAASKKLSEQLKKELPEANYNELKEFVEQWDIIMEGYQNITKKFLEKARINMNEARDGLYLAYVQNEENKQAIAYFEGKERMAALREHIEQVTGRQVKSHGRPSFSSSTGWRPPPPGRRARRTGG